MSNMATTKPYRKAVELLADARVKPHTRNSLLLGNFSSDKLPRGFSIEVNADTFSSVLAQTKITDTTSGRRYISYITNNGDKPLRVKIWQL